MAKSRSLDEDKQILQKKVQERGTASENPEGDEAIRSLHKRLKRVQRKLSILKKREQQTTSKKAKTEA
jgi:hypothetical protein